RARTPTAVIKTDLFPPRVWIGWTAIEEPPNRAGRDERGGDRAAGNRDRYWSRGCTQPRGVGRDSAKGIMARGNIAHREGKRITRSTKFVNSAGLETSK